MNGDEEHENRRNNLKCNACGTFFSSVFNLSYHEKTSHSTSNNAFESRFKCEQCNKTFCFRARLKKHIRSFHEKEKSHECIICKKKFFTKSHLKTHVRSVHEKLKPYECESCNKTFSTKETKTKHHKNIHEKEKNHFCEFCNKPFSNVSDLRKHELLARSFQCTKLFQKHKNASIHTILNHNT